MKPAVRQLSLGCGSAERAFTMIEIAISIAIVAFALVAIIGVLPTGLNVQRDNREETIVSQDAAYIIQAIRDGSTNLGILTRNIDMIQISNVIGSAAPTVPQNWLGMPNPIVGTNANTTPEMLLSFLTTPRYVRVTPGQEQTNWVTARIRAFSGPLAEKGDSTTARDLAFSYLLTCELIPFDAIPQSIIQAQAPNFPAPSMSPEERISRLMANNLYEMRLEFRWPVRPDPANAVSLGLPGNGRLVYRTLVAGSITNYPMAINSAYTASRFATIGGISFTNTLPKP